MSYQVLSSFQLLTFSTMINWLPDYLIKVKLVYAKKCSLWSWCWYNFWDDVDIESIINQFDVQEILRLRELLAIAGRHSGEVSHSQLTVLLKGQVLFASVVVVGGGGRLLNIYHHPHHALDQLFLILGTVWQFMIWQCTEFKRCKVRHNLKDFAQLTCFLRSMIMNFNFSLSLHCIILHDYSARARAPRWEINRHAEG